MDTLRALSSGSFQMSDPKSLLNLVQLQATVNVSLSISGPMFPCFLSRNGEVRNARLPTFNERSEMRQFWGAIHHRLQHRDWRGLRNDLVELDCKVPTKIAEWLNRAGYVPMRLATSRWSPEDIVEEIVDWVRVRRDIFAFLLSLERDDFRFLVTLLASYNEEVSRTLEVAFKSKEFKSIHPEQIADEFSHWEADRKLKEQLRLLKSGTDTGIRNLDLETLSKLVGHYRTFNCYFAYEAQGDPFIGISATDPMDAILLTIQIDRNFSARRLVDCRNRKSNICKQKRFQQDRASAKFCSDRCRTYYKTNLRREKIRQLNRFNAKWTRLSAEKKKGQRRLDWIRYQAEHELRKLYPEEDLNLLKIDREWIELQKLKAKT
jgi:hypothetical protein